MTTRGKNSAIRKLGFLAGTFGDGSVSIYAVPYPSDITATDGEDGPIFGESHHLFNPSPSDGNKSETGAGSSYRT